MTAIALESDITTNHIRFAHLVRIDFDQAVFESPEQHFDIWSRVLITKIVTELRFTPAVFRRALTILLPGVKSSLVQYC